MSKATGPIKYEPDIKVFFGALEVKDADGGDPRDEFGRLPVHSLASTPDIDLGREIVLPSAFLSSIDRFAQRPVMLAYHDMAQPAGLWPGQRISDDGLLLEGFVSGARPDIQQLVIDGVIAGASIGFNRKPGGVEWDEDQEVLVFTDLDLWEVSLVPLPMNPSTYVEVSKSMQSWMDTKSLELREGLRKSPTPPPAEEPEPVRASTVALSGLLPLAQALGRTGGAISGVAGEIAGNLD